MGNEFGAVIPVVGLNNGFVGQISRTGERVVIARQANSANAANISFGDTVVTLPDAAGGTFKQLADFVVNGGGAALTTASTTSASAAITPASLSGFQVGQFVFGAGIAQGSQVLSIGATTVTLTKNASATASGVSIYVANFSGVAAREVKTELIYPYVPGTPVLGFYAPGQLCEVLQRGSICVKVNYGTPQASQPVYLRTVLNGSIPAAVVGDLEAAPDGTNSFVLNYLEWRQGNVDANNVAEVTLLIRPSA